MFEPIPFRDRSRPVQIVLGAVIPAVAGAIAGVLIGISSTAYWGYAVLAAVGAFVAGFEHPDARSAAARGFVGGLIYGVALLVVHAIAGTHAKVSLGSFPPSLAVVTAVAGMLLGVFGARAARRRRDRL